MKNPRRYYMLAATLAALGAVAVAASPSGAAAGPCSASKLIAKMTLIPGSGAAGHIDYALSLKNTGHSACKVGNHPGLKLLKANGHALPTHVTNVGTSGSVTIAAGHTKKADLHFSPDIPSGGEPSPCEPKAHKVRVTLTGPAHGSLVGPVTPATSVCGHGAMLEKALV